VFRHKPKTHSFSWRLTVRFGGQSHGPRVLAALKSRICVGLVAQHLPLGVLVEHSGSWIRIYGDSPSVIARARAAVASAARAEHVEAEEQVEARRNATSAWRPANAPWLDPRDAEFLIDRRPAGPWGAEANPNRLQVHIELASRAQARDTREKLAHEGYELHGAGSYLFGFVDNRAAAEQLIRTLKPRTPGSARFFIEGDGYTYFL
jgi:hypothetical protein